MLEILNDLDTKLFLLINGLNSPFWDVVMYQVSQKLNWIPLYAVLIGWLLLKFRLKGVWILIGLILLVTLSDQASNLIKDNVQRLRPCQQENIAAAVHLVKGHCGGLYGFLSGHAANHFAIAVFTAVWFRKRWYWIGIISWATLIAYSRVYLGVHFPGDVVCGALLGSLLAWGLSLLMMRIPWLGPEKQKR